MSQIVVRESYDDCGGGEKISTVFFLDMNLQKTIYNLLKNNKSLFLVGSTDFGKTWFVKSNLIPFLQEKKMSVLYIKDCDNIPKLINESCAIIDEVEVLQDKNFLQKNNPNKKPYYDKEYLIKTKKWFNKLKNIKIPCVYIVTRNDKIEIQNFINTIKKTDWNNRKVKLIEFKKEDRIKIDKH